MLPAKLAYCILSKLALAQQHIPGKGVRPWAISPVLSLALNKVCPEEPAYRTEVLELGFVAFEAIMTAHFRHDGLDFSCLVFGQFHTLLLAGRRALTGDSSASLGMKKCFQSGKAYY
jgi:hypothetical protein